VAGFLWSALLLSCNVQKASDLPPGKFRSTHTSIELRNPCCAQAQVGFPSQPSNACVGPRVFDAPENK
jgi:hypothetical protein